MKKVVLMVLCVLTVGLLLSGCSSRDDRFTADNEIFTYDRVDPEKTQLVVSFIGNLTSGVYSICSEFEKANPDIQTIVIDITGGNSRVFPLGEWLKNGQAPDIMINAHSPELTSTYCENLSAKPYVSNFYAEALNSIAMDDGNLYSLPGPSDIDCMVYNKTLFERYGWKVPETFDEFIELCIQIREDTNGEIQPWNPNAKYQNSFQTAVEAFFYADLFGGADNIQWYYDFSEGKASFAGHMEPFFEGMQKLIDNDLILEEHFSYSATTRGKELHAGQIAMYNSPIKGGFYSDEYEFDFMPYPGQKPGEGYVNQTSTFVVSATKRERGDKEQEAVERFMEFYSSVEGQEAYIGEDLMKSNLKGVTADNSGRLSSIQPCLDAGRLFTMLDFYQEGYSTNFSLWDSVHQMALGEKTGAECIAAIDEKPYIKAEEVTKKDPETVAAADEFFTILETSEYIADMYKKAASADIGLIVNNIAYRGNLMKIFPGNLTPDHVTVLMPRSLGNETHLLKCSMTGRQLLDALNKPVGNDRIEDAVYAFSGLKCKIAPWNQLGSKYLSVKLADGTEIDDNRLYTAAFWEGTIEEEYITEVLETIEGTWEELMTAQLKADGRIKPAKDGRTELVWE